MSLTIRYPADLPISQRRDDIAGAIRDHQVVVLAGETGSGKTTQLPKICLELGRGTKGIIGHTQPRRIAARTVAERIAQELETPLGDLVGYTVRFHDQVGPNTRVKLMTDGILLAEIQRDRMLRAYDTLIIDEAHERSLTIDFLLGYLKQLLPRRPDLKVIITSATIDPQRFAAHFSDAPVIEVSGRTYPVEVRYRPLDALTAVEAPGARRGDTEPKDQNTAICDAVRELWRDIDGDILVFLSGEREIRDAAEAVGAMSLPGCDVLPLYGRLSAAEQHRVFNDHTGRRVVLATNVAETSLTVPGIRAVIDVGTARISRYSLRTKVQRLPIEPISQASANQRAGRCGRVAPGICIRLYAETDFDARPEFTEPEILRTNLASVVLQMAALGLGDVAAFPFLDPPDQRAVRDAIFLLDELGALDSKKADSPQLELTPTGRSLARLPVDPRLGRMLLEADTGGCLAELLVLTSAMSIQDPRERPTDQQAAAMQSHARFNDPTSDFVSYLNLWEHIREQQRELSSSAFRRMCRAEFLNYLRIREWQDLHQQLRRTARDLKLAHNNEPAPVANVHQAILAGLLSHVGLLEAPPEAPARRPRKQGAVPKPRRVRPEYRGARGAKFVLGNESALSKSTPTWIMAAELVETNRLYGRTAARIEPEWIERLAPHLVLRIYSEPRWDARRGAAVATERVTIFGLPLVVGRRVTYSTINPEISRDLFIRHALVERDWDNRHRALARIAEAIEDAQELAARARRAAPVIDDEMLYDFFDQRLPAEVVSAQHFDSWWKQTRQKHPDLLELPPGFFDAVKDIDQSAFPDTWTHDGIALGLTYRFEPGSVHDGVTVDIPIAVLNQLQVDAVDAPAAGQREELVIAMLRALPKDLRRPLVPIPDTARAALARLAEAPPREGETFLDALADELHDARGVRIPRSAWNFADVPTHLRATYRIVDPAGATVAEGKDLDALRQAVAPRIQQALADSAPDIERDSLTAWDIGELPKTVERVVGGHRTLGYPSLVDEGGRAAVRILATAAEQSAAMPLGLRRLLLLTVPSPAKAVAGALSNRQKLTLTANPHGSVSALLADCADAAVDRLVAANGGLVWRAAAFDTLQQTVRVQLPAVATAIARDVEPVLEVWREVQGLIPERPLPAWVDAIKDMRAQLAQLIRPGFIADAGSGRLRDITRYLNAVARRLERLPRDPDGDRAKQVRVDLVGEAYREALSGLPPFAPVPLAVREVRWMIEELRVSLFAQELGTSMRISDARIYRALDDALHA
ncbi:MAG: hrpA [Pseudonocardiales bacterium]|nr:hrpA [Pseudonocardiales bacterium]